MLFKLFVLGGIANYGAAGFFYWKSCRRLSSWKSARGKVVGLVTNYSSESSIPYPVVQFVTRDVRGIEFTNDVGALSYQVGQRVEVLYNPDAPHCAVINDVKSMWGIVIIGLVTGTVFWFLVCLMWMFS